MSKMQAIQPAPPAAVSRILGTFDRRQLASFIEVAIGLLDVASDDPDLEEGDLEDSFEISQIARHFAPGAGCEIADGGDTAWIEWQTMRPHQKKGHNLTAGREDDEEDVAHEEDDASGQCTEDEISTLPVLLNEGIDTRQIWNGRPGPGCIISDSDYTHGLEGR